MKRTIIIFLNLISFLVLIGYQNYASSQLIEVDISKHEYAEVIRNVGINYSQGANLNWILILAGILFIGNLLLFHIWIKTKRWILESFVLLVLSLFLGIWYHMDRVSNIRHELESTTNTT